MSLIVVEGSNATGKTTIIKKLQASYDFVYSRSIPDWFRKYLSFARSLSPELQKQVYMIGHEANYLSCNQNQDYILDRFFYSTIIRLNFELKRSVLDTVNEILEVNFLPDIVIILSANRELILKRLNERRDITFDSLFWEYENEVFRHLIEICDKIITIDNSCSIEATIDKIDTSLQTNKIFLKRR